MPHIAGSSAIPDKGSPPRQLPRNCHCPRLVAEAAKSPVTGLHGEIEIFEKAAQIHISVHDRSEGIVPRPVGSEKRANPIVKM